MTYPITLIVLYTACAAFGVLPWHYAVGDTLLSLLGYAAGRLAQKATS